MKIRKIFVFFFLLSVTISLKAQVSFGQAEKINENWRFRLQDQPDGQSPSLDDSRWQSICLPHDWSVKQQLSPTLASATGYLPGGIGWYRRKLRVPESQSGKKVYLYFEGVYNRSEVFINGQSLGKRPNGYISFLYDVSPYIRYGQDNVIAVRVDHSRSADSRWYTGSGIYRNVWLVYADPVHIAQWGVYAYPEKVKNHYVLQVEVTLENATDRDQSLKIVNELSDSEGRLLAKDSKSFSVPATGQQTLSTSLRVNNAKEWSIDHPELYRLKTSIFRGKELIDETVTTTGFRHYTFDPDKGFALNGNRMKVKGVCLHHDAGVLGAAVPKEVWRRRLLTLKEIGVNAIRTSHNPQAPDLYQLCDEIGLLVLNEAYDEWEFPKRKWLEGWNVGTPGFDGSFDFFEEWGERDLADLIRRDRNHISVFAWSIGNEVDYPNDPYSHPVLGGSGTGFTQAQFGGYKKDAPDAMRLGEIARRLVAVVKQYDKSRPVTAGLAGVAMSNETDYPGALDIAGYNYTESRYLSDHERYPDRVIYGSENRHELSAWKSVRDLEHIFGQFLWTGIDYLGESGRWPSRGFYSGLLDFGGFIKPRGYFRQSLWSDKPMVYLGTYPTPGKGSRSQMKDVWSQLDAENAGQNYEEKIPSMDAWPVWNYQEGQLIRVVCYTNTAKAQLFLNGVVYGELQDYDDNTGIVFWDVPYKAGKLEVAGYDRQGRETARFAIRSSERPEAITVRAVETTLAKEGGVAQVIVQVVDEKGVPVMLSDEELTCRLAGPGRLLGLEGSNNEDMSDYTDNKHRVFHGRLIAYIQATGEAGEINLRFSSPWLKPADIRLRAE